MLTRPEAVALVQETSCWFGTDPEGRLFKAAVLCLLGIGRRKHLSDLTKVSQYPREFVQGCLANMRANQIWRSEDKATYANWCEEPITLLLDAMVAEGTLTKTFTTEVQARPSGIA